MTESLGVRMGDKQFVWPEDGEEQPERNAYQQDGILFQIAATQQRKLDQPFPVPLLSFRRKKRCSDTYVGSSCAFPDGFSSQCHSE
jgi:hypothetical protein